MRFEVSDFIKLQMDFAAYIRSPSSVSLPKGVCLDRMQAYRALFINNMEAFLSSGFPVLKVIMNDGWMSLVHDFYSRHRSTSPLFIEIGKEFLHYLDYERGVSPSDPPFIRELAHYEWVELALAISEDSPPDVLGELPDSFLDAKVKLSKVAWPLVYRFPVHSIHKDNQPQVPPDEPTHLVVYRYQSDDVKFMEINDITYRLLKMLQADGDSLLKEVLAKVADELSYSDLNSFLLFGNDLISRLHQRSVVVLS